MAHQFAVVLGGTYSGAVMNSEIRPQRALTAADAWRRGVRRGPGLVISHISAQNPEREITLEIGQREIRIHRSCGFKSQNKQQRGIRRVVTRFSKSSKRRLLFVARNFPGLEIMLTLTYPSDFPMNGRMVKDHWRRFRQWMIRNNAGTGLWVLEFQKRGAPHFHVFIREALDRHAVSAAWYRIVNSGDPRHLRAGTRIEVFRHPPALGSYVMKYAAKMEQKEVPEGFASVGRFWGTWGNPQISREIRLPQCAAKHFVRAIRRAHMKARKTWRFHRHFRDNGKSGFIAWETSRVVRRMIDEFMEDGVLHVT